ncbi:hypothetical protein Zmor_003391 [Zophobas morio]|uniref:Uncharacterized protein n=1 Tax=Zophobas morio TaxID=2755281 RepID=A0AA38M180_9CUCU|nr:hypothetical protein Zmor_003391 [Zophobas morio]
MTRQVGESRERGVLAVDRPVVAVVATECNREYVCWLGWEISPVSGGNLVTYGRGGVLSTLAETALLLRGAVGGQYIPNCTARAITGNSTTSPEDCALKTTP